MWMHDRKRIRLPARQLRLRDEADEAEDKRRLARLDVLVDVDVMPVDEEEAPAPRVQPCAEMKRNG